MLRDTVLSLTFASLLAGCAARADAQPRPRPDASITATPDASITATPDASIRATRDESTRCRRDDDCGWDDSCMPTACVLGGPRQPVACTESRPPPGDCRCEQGACAIRRRAPTRASEAVPCSTWRDCSWQHNPLRAVSSRRVRRPVARPVRACRDGEVDSVCVQGTCRITAWGC